MSRKYTQESEKTFILIIGFIFLILTFIVLKDIFSVIIFSMILAYFLFPLYNFYNRKIKQENLSSLLTLVTATFIFFVPFALLSYFIIINLLRILLQYKIYIENPEILNTILSDFFQKFSNSSVLSSVNFYELFNNVVIFILDYIRNFFSSIPTAILYFFIVLFITYYILIYNQKLLFAFNEYIPLSLRKQNEIIRNITKNIKVLFKGYFLTGIIQTIIAIIGYIIFGAPNILIISALTLFVSLIPYLGTPLVWVPVSLYLVIVGEQFNGIGLLLYGTFIISMVDNFVRPILMSDKETIAPPLVFIGFVGGLLAFGILGIILGPLIISITIILLRYVKEYYELRSS